MVKTAIFDLGGVLVNLDWDSVCTQLQKRSALADVRPEVINGPIVMSAMLGCLNPHAYHEALCEKLVSNLTYQEFVEIWNGLLSANEDIVPLIEEVKARHRLVLASNTDAIHFASAIDRFPVLKSFELRFLSCEMHLLKPDPAFFHHVLKTLGALPSECIFIDDRSENVESAREIGIAATQFKNVHELRASLEATL